MKPGSCEAPGFCHFEDAVNSLSFLKTDTKISSFNKKKETFGGE